MNLKRFFEKDPRIIYGVVFIAALLIVIIPVSNTISMFVHYGEIQGKLKAVSSSPEQPTISSSNDKLLEKDADYTKKVFGLLSESCKTNSVTVKQVELPRKSLTADVQIESQQITMEGPFVNILKALNEINEQIEPVKISSVAFRTETINKEKVLTSQIVFQSVKLQDAHE